MSEQQEAPTEAPNITVDLQRVNLTALNAALAEVPGVKLTARTTVQQRVDMLQAHELSQSPTDEELPEEERKLGQCSVCNGFSQLSRPSCPFCGTAEDQPAPAAPVTNPAPRSAKEAKNKAASKEKPEKPEKPASPAAAIEKASGKILKKHVDAINGIERRIKGLLADSVESHWTVGRELAQVLKGGEWKYRVTDDGKPTYSGFGDWVHETFGITPQYARQLIAVSEAYTAKQVREVGVKKLNIALRLPEEKRTEVLAKNSTATELTSEVQRLAPGASREPIAAGGSTARPHAAGIKGGRRADKAQPSYVPKENEVTAVLALRRYELPMFARAKSAETEQPIRAKTIAANPTAVLDIQNGVRVVVKLTEDENGLIAVLEFERVTEEAAAE